LDEVAHHGGEIGLLRDLFLARGRLILRRLALELVEDGYAAAMSFEPSPIVTRRYLRRPWCR
jgi:hypothetical protein